MKILSAFDDFGLTFCSFKNYSLICDFRESAAFRNSPNLLVQIESSQLRGGQLDQVAVRSSL